MNPRRSFERRLRIALMLSSILPSLLLVGAGTLALAEWVAATDSFTAWERVAATGGDLLDAAEGTADPELSAAAARHREELAASVVQARRLEYLVRRSLAALPWVALAVAALLAAASFRAARRIARGLSRPVGELAGWSERIARGEPLPPPGEEEAVGAREFRLLRDAFRRMEGELEASRARALEAERMRTWIEVARRVAHELKNPLTPMRLAVRALDRVRPASEPEREALEVIAAESARLEELASAFAQFGELPEGPDSEVDLRELLDYLVRTQLPPEVPGRLRSAVDLPRVRGHYEALSRAFANLLRNAAEAVGEAGGAVTVVLAARDAGVEVRVLDTGPGVPEGVRERIWEPDVTTKSRGTGLGLALVRQTVARHGGRVSAGNRPEGGAEFRVWLPVEGPGAAETSAPAEG